MIPKAAEKGSRTVGLLYYLWGPGKANEHTNPHMIAAWDDGIMERRDPARSTDATLPALGRLLDAPVDTMEGRRPAKHVYHVPVSLGKDDRILTDAEWNMVAREILDAVGIAPKDDPAKGCRWIAMRHADNHIHIVATLATEEGRVPNLRGDWPRMQKRARELEKQLGLRQLASGDKTAKQWPKMAELEKAKRHGRGEAPRVTLQRQVREAAAGAGNEEDFFRRLAGAGLRVNQRVAPDGAVTGYSVALVGDRTAVGRAVWYSGSRLAPDLSLPRVRERWAQQPIAQEGLTPTRRVEAWRQAAHHISEAGRMLASSGNEQGAGAVAALGDLLTTYAAEAPSYVRDEIRAAAAAFERAGRAPAARRSSSQARGHLQAAAQQLALGAALAAGGGEIAAVLALLGAVALAVVAAVEWHQAQGFRVQADAARTAGAHLRQAQEVTRGAASARKGLRPRPRGASTMGAAGREQATSRYAPVVGTVLPDRAEDITEDAAWGALAASLETAEAAGYDPETVLAEVAAQRELTTADSVAEVLTWRLQGRMRRDSVTPQRSTTTRKKTGPPQPPTTPPRNDLGQASEAQRAAQRAQENRPRGPRR
ncbi:relaxase/mobilization nuclease domain-containing protein [Streptomyces sp. NPDC001633]|uniref:relaxase/mobilization nuclease domain-containing protein n=1 Tax=Streptomyces sp. NPDC001633 TaxID=3364595 RepID=UPI0036BCDAFB